MSMNKEMRALLEALRSVESPIDVVPPGWLTMQQLCKELDIGPMAVTARLRAAGCEVRKFRVRTKTGTVRNIQHYGLKTKNPGPSRGG